MAKITNNQPVIISAQSEHLHQADPDAEQNSGAILWLGKVWGVVILAACFLCIVLTWLQAVAR